MAGTMGLPPIQNFEYYVGDTGSFALEMIDDTGQPYDMSGLTAKFVMSDILSLSPVWSINGVAVIDGNSVICTINPTTGLQLAGKKIVYDVEITDGADFVQTVLRGSINPTVGVHEQL